MTGLSLVTGGAGFVGRHLVKALRNRGERARSFDLAAATSDDEVQGSILDEDALVAAMVRVETVFHLAGNAQLWARVASVFEEVNHVGTRRVIAAAKRAGVKRLVHCSSLTTLVGSGAPIGASNADEETMRTEADMLGSYPLSKLRAELAVKSAADEGLDAVIAIPTEPLSANDDSLTPPTQMILDFANGKTPAYIDCILNFVPVKNLADGLIATRDNGKSGERYLLGGEHGPARLLALIETKTGTPAPKTKMLLGRARRRNRRYRACIRDYARKPPKAPLTGVRLAGRQVSFSSEKTARDLGWRAA
ncbi:MAG: NAD-dependent epimerase/dehydratase family protein [Parvularculaceae bacterium]